MRRNSAHLSGPVISRQVTSCHVRYLGTQLISAKLRLCFVRDFFWLSNSFIISFATVLALRLRAEIIGGLSTSTTVIGALFPAGAPSSPTVAVVGVHIEQ